ncbi:MAG: PG0541 family transporter-associated protein [Candidatus Omnitrophota bacterium]
MDKMVMVVYNEALDMEVMEALENCALRNFTKILGAFGSGCASGFHLGTDVWPGRNNILYAACTEPQSRQLLSCVRELRKKISHEGIKAFVLPIEAAT